MDKNKKLFPQRLWELIHDKKYNFCLRWSPDGQRVYLNRNEFESNYLKTPNNQFHTQKAISFVRQMNMYGFRKVDDCYYENDNFKRNRPHLLKNMVRRHSNKGFYSQVNSNDHNQQQQLQQHQQQNSQQQQNHGSIIARSHHNRHHQTSPQQRRLQQQQQQQQQQQPLLVQHDLNQHSIVNQSIFLQGPRTTTNSVSLSPRASSVAPTGPAAINTDRQQARLYEEAVGNSISNIGAALAAINCSSNNNSGNTRSAPLASTLYHRLAALSFNQSAHSTTEQQHQLLQQLKQPQPPLPLTLQRQNLLTSLQQQDPNLLLESLANLGSIAAAAASAASSSGVPRQTMENQASMRPLELVVNATNSVPDNDQRNLFSRFLNSTNSLLGQANMASDDIMSNNAGLFYDDHVADSNTGDDDDDDDNDDHNSRPVNGADCTIDFGDGLFNRSGSLRAHSSSSSSPNQEPLRYARHNPDDVSDAVLNLAKPSNTRSNGWAPTKAK